MKNLRPTGRLVKRLLYILSNYNFILEHKRSKEMVNADCPTREGCRGPLTTGKFKMKRDRKDITIFSLVIQRGCLDTVNWKKEQGKDEDLKSVKQSLNDGNPPYKDDLKIRSTTV